MKMKKITAMSMAVLMAATMIRQYRLWQTEAERFTTSTSNQSRMKPGRIWQKLTQKKQEQM